MRNLKMVFQTALVGFGLFSMIVIGAITFDRETDRRMCAERPLAEFVQHDEWNWTCRDPSVSKASIDAADLKA